MRVLLKLIKLSFCSSIAVRVAQWGPLVKKGAYRPLATLFGNLSHGWHYPFFYNWMIGEHGQPGCPSQGTPNFPVNIRKVSMVSGGASKVYMLPYLVDCSVTRRQSSEGSIRTNSTSQRSHQMFCDDQRPVR